MFEQSGPRSGQVIFYPPRKQMSRTLIEISHCNVDLELRPIEPSWIIEGNPVSRSHILSTSADGTASTIIWACTEGRFNWYYDIDETIMIMEGSIVLESDGMPPKRYGPGDVIFFRDGAHAKWHVEGHVKKIAFCRKTNPVMIGFLIRVVNKLKKIFVATGERRPASLMGAN
ncbi:cupin [Bradyrhizobium canariense]|nr:cupin [Bradyrhizobium canariense]OSI29155.1 cupin [Bradyrhizobium canariense]OSI44246.1 cupin [Bradyrhizobium canariense]OSI51997.1 cupin [Bradyrhizobium canariense]OSI54453.1 cupin [Bradyrhizobium canariense]